MSLLILRARVGDEIIIGNEMVVMKIKRFIGHQISFGFEAAESIEINRRKIYQRKLDNNNYNLNRHPKPVDFMNDYTRSGDL